MNKVIKDKIKNIFDFVPETNITEEYFYEHKGNSPVFSGQNEENGIVATIDTWKQEGQCVTFTTYGSAGKMFYRSGRYTIGRNCMGLKVKEHYKEDINLQWFAYYFQGTFYSLTIGDQMGQRSLNKKILENVEVIIPHRSIQEKQLGYYNKAQNILDYLSEQRKSLCSLLKNKIKIENHYETEIVDNMFYMVGGNSGLTEEFMYNNKPDEESDKIPILSSATMETNLMGYISRKAKPNNKNLKIFLGPCILVARNGYAGTMEYIEKDEFTTNDHAYVMTLKPSWKDKINLRWFIQEYQNLFYNLVTSKSDNATFNKEYVEKKKVIIPDKIIQDSIAKKLLQIDNLLKEVDILSNELNELLIPRIINL